MTPKAFEQWKLWVMSDAALDVARRCAERAIRPSALIGEKVPPYVALAIDLALMIRISNAKDGLS